MGCSHHDAQDIVQETFLKAMMYIEILDGEYLSAWLFRVARNHFLDLCRHQQRHAAFSLDEQTGSQLVADSLDMEKMLVTKEACLQVQDVLNHLSLRNRELLLMKYEAGLSCQEMARLLGIKEGSVRTALYRARQQFKTRWEEEVNG